jgi:rare lipoprotein A
VARSVPLGVVALALLPAACAHGFGPRPAPATAAPAVHPAALVAPATAAPTGPRYVIGKPYQFDGVWYRPAVDDAYDSVGDAAVYGPEAAGRPTVDGEAYDPKALTAAHKTLPLPSVALVRNLANGLQVKVRINDRGPFRDDRIVELSAAAAERLRIKPGTIARVRLRILAAESRALAEDLGAGAARAVTPAPTPRVAVQALAAQPPQPAPAPSPPASPPPPPPVAGSKPPAPSPAPEPAPKAAVAPGFYIQAGAFRDAGNAAQLRDKLAALGPAAVVAIERNGQRLNGVRLGPIAARAEAKRLLKRVIELGQKDAWLVAVGTS